MDDIHIVLTGSRHDDHYRVDVNGKPILLPCASFIVLVDLVAARLQTESGFLAVPRSRIHRLRKSLGARLGKRLIDVAGDGEYLLTIPKAKMAEHFFVTPCFFELENSGTVPKAVAEMLRNSFQSVQLREI